LISLDQNIFLACTNTQQKDCFNLTLHHYLYAPYWIAIQSALQLLLTTYILYFVTRKKPEFSIQQALIIGLFTAFALLNIIEPGRLPAIIAFIGSVAGGAISTLKSKPAVSN